jgi:hypothetical protein
MEEIRTIQSITADNLRVLENVLLDVKDFEKSLCGHSHCASDTASRISDEGEGSGRWEPESMTQRLEWAIAMLQEREGDLCRMNTYFDYSLKNVSDSSALFLY